MLFVRQLRYAVVSRNPVNRRSPVMHELLRTRPYVEYRQEFWAVRIKLDNCEEGFKRRLCEGCPSIQSNGSTDCTLLLYERRCTRLQMAPNLLGGSDGLVLGAVEQMADPEYIIGNTNSQKFTARNRGISQIPSSDASFSDKRDATDYKLEIVWRNVVVFAILQAFAIYCVFLLVTLRMSMLTFVVAYLYSTFAGMGVTGGAHRLWAHRSYKANLPLRIFLMLAHCAALQNTIHEWARDHRVHHKFTDTNADPHNVSRGFFFSHVGWLLCKKHKDVIEKGKTIDMSDVLADPVVKFQMKYYLPLIFVLNLVIPTLLVRYLVVDTLALALVASMGRYSLSLHGTWLVNSAAHIWGMQPYDKSITPTENKVVAVLAYGEGWHNYHHVFPWDYKAAELGNYRFNITTGFLDFMAKIGWATELKTASDDMIIKRILRTGDGMAPSVKEVETKTQNHQHDEEMIWGWGDKDMDKEEIMEIASTNRIKA